jgi:hypothetical protein
MTASNKKLLTVGGGAGIVVVIAAVIILSRGDSGSASPSSSDAYFATDHSDNPQEGSEASVAQRGERTGEERGRSSRLSGSTTATNKDDTGEVLGENVRFSERTRRRTRGRDEIGDLPPAQRTTPKRRPRLCRSGLRTKRCAARDKNGLSRATAWRRTAFSLCARDCTLNCGRRMNSAGLRPRSFRRRIMPRRPGGAGVR